MDLGCGTGAGAVPLAQMGATRVSGLDLSSVSIETARLRAERAGLVDLMHFDVGDAASTSLS